LYQSVHDYRRYTSATVRTVDEVVSKWFLGGTLKRFTLLHWWDDFGNSGTIARFPWLRVWKAIPCKWYIGNTLC